MILYVFIFDRVREELGGRRSNLEEVVNKSISQTLKRFINTSLTTLLAILSLYIMGVESIREFTLLKTGFVRQLCLL